MAEEIIWKKIQLLQRTHLHHRDKEQGDHWNCPLFKSLPNAAEKRGEETEEHECQKNFKGISNSMEASEIMKMVEDYFYNRFFIIDVIVRDDDSTMRAVLNHPSKGARGQVLKSPKGELHTDIPEPSFLADPSHRVKVVAKHVFSVVNGSRDLRCGCTKPDALLIKKDW